ncbi:hypothetical protein [Streptomyces shaanxiensis]
MRVATQSRTSRWGMRFGGAGLAAALAVGVAGSPASAQAGAPSASGVQPIEITAEQVPGGNPTFADLEELGFGDFNCAFEPFKVEPVTAGTHNFPSPINGSVTIELVNTADGPTFNFRINGEFATIGVIVKGGPNANFYDYRPDGIGSDEALHAPINPMSGDYYGLSHVDFCVIDSPYNGDNGATANS